MWKRRPPKPFFCNFEILLGVILGSLLVDFWSLLVDFWKVLLLFFGSVSGAAPGPLLAPFWDGSLILGTCLVKYWRCFLRKTRFYLHPSSFFKKSAKDVRRKMIVRYVSLFHLVPYGAISRRNDACFRHTKNHNSDPHQLSPTKRANCF